MRFNCIFLHHFETNKCQKFLRLSLCLLAVKFSCSFIRGAGSHTMLRSDVPSSPTIPHPLQHPFIYVLMRTYCTDPHIPYTLHLPNTCCPPPYFHPNSFKTKHTQHSTVPPRHPTPPVTRGHPMPRTFLSDREHDTGPLHPHLLCGPPSSSEPPSSIHHICPPASITSPQRQPNQRKEKAKKRGEEYSRYHAEQC